MNGYKSINVEECKQDIINGMTNIEIMNKYNVTKSVFRNFLHKNNLKLTELRGYIIQNKILRKDYLKDLEFKYYLFGFLASDGQIDEDRNRVRLCLNDKDKHILLEIKKRIFENYEDVKLYYKTGGYRKDGTLKEYYDIHITDKYLVTELLKYDIYQCRKKTMDIKFNLIPEENLKDFIRGYFDGDGSVGISNKKYLRTRVVGNKMTMTNLFNIIKYNFNIQSVRLKDVTGIKYSFPFYEIEIPDNIGNNIFFNTIYKNSTIFLQRKYDVFKQIIN